MQLQVVIQVLPDNLLGFPACPLVFSLCCFQDAEIHREIQNVQGLKARSISLNARNTLYKYLLHCPRSPSTPASQTSPFAVIFGKDRTICLKLMSDQLRGC